MAEIGMPRAGGDDQVIEADPAILGHHFIRRKIDVDDAIHEDGRVLLVPEDVADGCGDLSRRQAGGRYLIEQRLEEMIVAAIDDGHIGIRLAKVERCLEAAEACTKYKYFCAHDEIRSSGGEATGRVVSCVC